LNQVVAYLQDSLERDHSLSGTREEEIYLSPDIVTSGRLEELFDAWRDAEESGWDGYPDSRPAHLESLWWGRAFLEALPISWPSPEISVDPDGDLTFEWSEGATRVFTVSIGKTGAAHYAGLYGQARVHGMEPSLEGLPQVVAANLARLYPPALRLAG
jgi:hypothetical protein